MKFLIGVVFACSLVAQTLPSHATPGALYPSIVTQDNIKTTICKPGWTKTVRPSVGYTNMMKLGQMDALGLGKKNPKDYEEDHKVPLELGGNPSSALNLWPEHWSKPYGAHEKDKLENAVKKDVCSGKLTLAAAQAIFLGNFWDEYKRRYEKTTKK